MPSKPNHRSLLRALAGAAAALLALAATPATAQTITLADGSNPTAGTPACPGGGFIQVNAFSLSFPTSTTATGVRLGFVKPGTWQLVDLLEVRDGATAIGSIVPTSDYPIVRFPALTITAAPKTLTIWAKLKGHEFMPPPGAGKSPEIGVAVSSVVSMYATTGSDATSLMPINNGTPPDIAWSTVSSTASSVTASWKSGPRNAVVLRQIGGPVTGVPVEGRAYSLADGTIGADTIVAAGPALTGFTDSGRAAGKPHYYKVFVRDAAQDCGNWSLGASLGPVFTAGAVAEGATTGTGPVVGILNPAGGTVTAPFKIQARVFSPNGAISNVIAEADDGVAATPVALTLARNNNYGAAVDNGVFEGSYPETGAGSLVAGKYYTLRVKATNASGTLYSGAVGVQLTTGKGDGNLLRRDNSSQLCDDCHGGQIKTHGSDATGTKYGAWYVGCRGCHTPHSTTNAALVATEITPPRAGGVQLPPARVVFSTSGGFDPAAGATNAATIAAGSFANGDLTGPCQVCHTRTSVFRRSAQAADRTHNPGMPCSNCHKHTAGFSGAGGCTGCHGDAAGTRTDFSVVAPPKDTCGNATGGRVGAHAKHLSTTSGTISDGVACSECHVESPTGTHPRAAGANCSTDSALKAQMTWGTLASTNGAPSPYDYTSQTCSATYCHGNFPNSGVTSSVTWNGSAACGSCHHLGTRSGHTTSTNCGSCHGAGYSQGAVTPGSVAWGRHVDGIVQATGDSCFACHGDTSGARVATSGVETTLDRYKGAPPATVSVPGRPTPTTQAHLQHVYTPNMQVRAPLTCDACHPTISALDHSNDVLDLPFTGLARTGGVTPAYDDAPGALQFSCATTWCHGGGLAVEARGSQTRPYWTSTDGTQDTCASCHASPPANAKHLSQTTRGLTAASTCNPCHGATVAAAGAIVINYTAADKHVDGVFDATVTCASCHANPPTQADNRPANAANANAAGAHQQHAVTLQTRTAVYACTTCHPNNTSMTHASGGAVNMTFAASFATSTTWSDAGSSCATSYCHGTATVNNTPPIYKAGAATGLVAVAQSRWYPGQAAPVVWTQLDGRYRACTACHGAPPNGVAAVHPDNTNCAQCHPAGATQTAIAAASAAAGAHVDGRVDVLRTGCTSCHGDFASDAVAFNGTLAMPGATATARDTVGLTAPSAAGVGSHLKHYSGTGLKNANGGRAAVCADCHSGVIPAVNNDVAHVTGSSPTAGQGSRATIAFSNVARTGLASGGTPLASAYQGSTTAAGGNVAGTCNSTYCHGKFGGVAGYQGSNPNPRFTDPAMTCGSCHASPPGDANHTGVLHATSPKNCSVCHGANYNCTVRTAGNFSTCNIANPATHIDGNQDVTVSCTTCHGQPPGTVAELADPANNPTGIGAHDAHFAASTYTATGYGCATCHGSVPVDTVHVNSTIESGWSAFASSGITPTPAAFNAAFELSGSCSNYCHTPGSAATMGGSNRAPIWTRGATQAACGTCHGNPPPVSGTAGVDHPQNSNCQACHGTGYVNNAMTAAAKDTHLNGSVRVGVDKPANGCTACHGALAGLAGAAAANTDPAAAPGYNGTGVDTNGAVAATVSGVGAHDAHVRPAGSLNSTAAIVCATCHGTVPAPGDTNHANNAVAAAWAQMVGSTGITVVPAAGTFAANPSCTNYCHSNAAPVGGTRATTSVSWTAGTANLTCTSCHAVQADNPASAASTKLSHSHWVHLAPNANGGYFYACSECHNAVGTTKWDYPTTAGSITNPANHVSGSHSVTFNAATNPGTPSYNQAYQANPFTCANTYCHSNGTNAATPPANLSIRWDSGSATCSSCHQAGTALNTNAHGAHVNNAGVIGANYRCADCHKTTLAAGTDATIIGTTLHVNRVKDVSIANRGSFVSTDTSATCSATYCHSSGQATPAYRTIAWTAAAIGCNACHGTGNVAGSPDYASGAMASATANSHAKHTGNGTDATKCDDCHNGFVTAAGTGILGSSHTNGTRNVMIAASFDSNGATTNYNPANKACASVTCHGGSVAQWGGPAMTCSNCHTDPTTDTDDYVTNNGTPSKVATDEWTARGHGSTNATFNEFTAAATDRCLYCHDGNVAHALAANPYRLRGAADVNGATAAYNATSAKNGNEVCLNCHDTSNAVANGVDPDAGGTQPRVCQGTGANPCDKKVDAWHAGTDHTATLDGGTRCWDCHDPHGDDGVLMIGRRLLMDATDAYGLAGTRTTIDTSFANTTAVSYANTTNRQGVCQVCHTTTTYWQQTANATRDAHNPGTLCVSCHAHQQAPNEAFKGAGDCTQCHAGSQPMAAGGSRRPIMPEFQLAWSHKKSSGAAGSRVVTNNDCAVCHMEGDTATGEMRAGAHGNGTIELRDPDTGTTIMAVNPPAANSSAAYTNTSTPVSFTRFSRNLSSNVIEPEVAAMMINQCLKCHDGNGATHASARVPGATDPAKPFGLTIAGAEYTGVGMTANGTAGGVVNVDASFNTSTLAAYHPIKFRNNNRFVSNTRMRPPWNTSTNRTTAATSGSTNTWGFLITCWDCHAPTNALGTQTMTVTAHGAAVTVKSTIWNTASGLCKSCHIPYVTSTATSSHGAGSALNSNTNGSMSTYIQNQCHYCHSSGVTKPARPRAGQDVHGFDTFGAQMGTDTMWPIGGTNTWRPFGFMRSVGATYSGRWVVTGTATTPFTGSWKPLSGPGVPAGTSTCGGTMNTSSCADNMSTYTPGGVY